MNTTVARYLRGRTPESVAIARKASVSDEEWLMSPFFEKPWWAGYKDHGPSGRACRRRVAGPRIMGGATSFTSICTPVGCENMTSDFRPAGPSSGGRINRTDKAEANAGRSGRLSKTHSAAVTLSTGLRGMTSCHSRCDVFRPTYQTEAATATRL